MMNTLIILHCCMIFMYQRKQNCKLLLALKLLRGSLNSGSMSNSQNKCVEIVKKKKKKVKAS